MLLTTGKVGSFFLFFVHVCARHFRNAFLPQRYLLGRGCRAATTRGFAEPELAHEMGEGVGEARRRPSPGGARPGPRLRREEQQRKSLRRLGSRRRPAAMNQRAKGKNLSEPRAQKPRVRENASRFTIYRTEVTLRMEVGMFLRCERSTSIYVGHRRVSSEAE